jgi:predicted dehydrogenase
MAMDVVRVGIVGLEFGAEFIPIYQAHPGAEMRAICQRSRSKLDEIGDRFDVPVRYDDYDAMLRDPELDVIHINTPLQHHADHVVAALRAGKHVGCTIPMATSVEDCKRIVDAQRETGLVYMMMETVLYSREYLFVRELYETGRLGSLQFLRSSHVQDMTGWPSYWDGMPPMHNATHAISPALSLGDDQAEYVQALGSGLVFPRMRDAYGSRFAVETTHISFLNSGRGAEVTRSLWAVARQYRESFDAYGSIRSFEWSQLEDEEPVVYTGERPERVEVPDYGHLLPAEIAHFTRGGVYSSEAGEQHLSFTQGGGHGGSHPHLAHRLLQAVRGEAVAYPDAVRAANITCSGILSHESALRGGERIPLPDWTLRDDHRPHEILIDDQPEPAWRDEAPLLSRHT